MCLTLGALAICCSEKLIHKSIHSCGKLLHGFHNDRVTAVLVFHTLSSAPCSFSRLIKLRVSVFSLGNLVPAHFATPCRLCFSSRLHFLEMFAFLASFRQFFLLLLASLFLIQILITSGLGACAGTFSTAKGVPDGERRINSSKLHLCRACG